MFNRARTIVLLRQQLTTRKYSSFHFPSLTPASSTCWSPEEAKYSITRATNTTTTTTTPPAPYTDISYSKRPDILRNKIIRHFSHEPAPSPAFLAVAFTTAANLAQTADTHEMNSRLSNQHVESTHVGYSAEDAYNVASQLKSRVTSLAEDDEALLSAGAYRAYLRVLVATRRGDEAKDTLEEMRKNGYLPSVYTYRLVMNAVARDGTIEEAIESIQGAIDSLSVSPSQAPTILQTAAHVAIGTVCAQLSLLSLVFAPHPAVTALVSSGLFATAYAASKEAEKYFQRSPILETNELLSETEVETYETSRYEGDFGNKIDLQKDLYGHLLVVLAREHRFQCTYDVLCHMRKNNIKMNSWTSQNLRQYLNKTFSIPEARALLDHLNLV